MSSAARFPFGEIFLLAVILLIVFAIGMAIYRFLRKPGTTFTHVLAGSERLEVAEQEVRLENLESRIELMLSLMFEIKEQLYRINAILANREVEVKEGTSQYEEIYRAFDQGKDIGELVRQFGRDKGEIELILNLRKASN